MRIGIDGRNLGRSGGTGVAAYAGILAGTLPAIGLQAEILRDRPLRPRPLRWLAAAWPAPSVSVQTDAGRDAADVFRVAQVHFDMWRRLRRVSGRGLPDAMHWTYPLPLVMPGRPNLYTVHDLIPLLHPTLTGIDAGRFRRILTQILRHADHVVTVSDATRRELLAHLRLDPERVTDTGQAVAVAGAAALCPAGLARGGYWLHVGAVERRKNLPRLIAAWRASGTRHPLVLAGPDGWGAAETLSEAGGDLVAALPPGRSGVLRLPWLDRPSLLALIRDARALLMPSLAEGFGLPVAEAMALGTPVLTSGRGALAEVAGGAAMLVAPEDGGALTEALRALDGDAERRRMLGEAGRARAVAFSQDRYAARLDALYRRVLPYSA